MNTLQKEKPLYKDMTFYLLNLFCFMSTITSIMSPAFPAIAENFHVSYDQTGLLSTTSSIAVIIGSPLVGILGDKLGRKKVIFASLLLFLVFGIGCIVSTTFPMLMAFTFFAALGLPALLVLPVVLVGDLYRGNKRVQAMGVTNSSAHIGLAAFPLISGFVVGFSWNYPYFIYLLALPAAVLTLLFLKEPEFEHNQEKFGPYLRRALVTFKKKEVFSISVVSFSQYLMLGGCYIVFMPFLIIETTGEPMYIGVAMSVMAVVSVIPGYALGSFAKIISVETLTKIGLALIAVSFFLSIYVNSIPSVMVANAVFGFGIGLNIPSFYELYAPHTTDDVRSAYMAVVNIINRVGEALGPVVFGLVFAAFGISRVFLAGGIFCLAVLLYNVCFLRRQRGGFSDQEARRA